jgi:hypothetical protein
MDRFALRRKPHTLKDSLLRCGESLDGFGYALTVDVAGSYRAAITLRPFPR